MTLNWDTITGPTVLINRSRAQRNIATMQAKAKSAQVALRPHFKTHQSALIGTWFGPPESTPIAVSSLAMAEYFVAAGWRDVHIAIPLNPRELPAIQALAQQAKLTLTIEHEDALAYVAQITTPVQLMLEVDTGYGRTGFDWRQQHRIAATIKTAHGMEHVKRIGLMVHSGHSYGAQGETAIAAVHTESTARLNELMAALSKHVQPPLWVSVGDTPTCSRMDSFPGANEIRPGNYVFYDMQQKMIGACDWDDIALAMACPVIGRYPERNEVVVHGGAVHFGKDWVSSGAGSHTRTVFGQVMQQTESGWSQPVEGAEVIGLSQEHGKVRMPQSAIEKLRLGDLLVIVPPHSCLVMAAAMAFGDEHFICFDGAKG
ncbi:alanine racemase [Aliidiomarina taiwanensis]|nr:alanine racemase [Aliidiomarina taiwanensis]